jgi:hypothetical protein
MRTLTLLLLLANLGFLALARGWLEPYAGLSTQREPQRLAAQHQPQSVRVLDAKAASAAMAASQPPAVPN